MNRVKTAPEQKGQLTWNLVGSIVMTWRLKIVLIGNPVLKIYFELHNGKASWLETSLEVSRWYADQEYVK